MEVRQLYAFARRWIWVLIPCIIAGAAIAILLMPMLPKTYESTSTLLVGQPFRATTDNLTAQRLQAQTYAELAILRPMLQKVIDTVGLQETPEELARQVVVRASRTSNLLTIAVSNTEPETAATIANAVADQLIALSREPVSNPRPPNLPVAEPTTLTEVEAAVPAATPSSPRVALITALGAAGGLLVAVVMIALIVFIREARGAKRVEAGY